MQLPIFSCLVAMLAVGVVPASAQITPPSQPTGTQSNRPYRGLFGAPPDASASQQLRLSFVMGGGYDDNVLISDLAAGSGQARLLQGRRSTTGHASLNLDYMRQGDLLTLTAAATSSASYYPAIPRPFSSRHTGNVNAAFQFSQRTRLDISHQMSYEPYYSFAAFASTTDPTVGSLPASDPGTNTQLDSRITSGTNIAFSRNITRRIAGSVFGGYHRSGLGFADLQMANYQGGGRVSYLVGRGVSVAVRYGFTQAGFGRGSANQYRSHNVDVQLGFNRAISLGRSTLLSFGTGIATLRNQDQTRYLLRGYLSLQREIGRTWTAFVVYGRNVQYLDILRAPALADALSFQIGGLAGRRVSLNFGAGLSTGEVGAGQGAFAPDRFHTYYGATSVTFGITRNIGLSTSYSHFRYRVGDDIVLPPGLPRKTNRQGIRVALQISPVFAWTRR